MILQNIPIDLNNDIKQLSAGIEKIYREHKDSVMSSMPKECREISKQCLSKMFYHAFFVH